ncbi:MAG: DUF2911 domain-containing protein [Cyclobacteriaceae bacterium]|nr:DUF2911 domain-containing protein [Cyclobacteriaceae bacterium]
MKKKLFIGIGIFILLLVLGFVYLNHRNRTLSPPGIVKYDKNDLMIEIPYSRPSQKGRLIFGTEQDGALLPYGKYWRLGANEATEITFNRDVLFNGQQVAAGTYRIYAVPGEKQFEVVLNSELGKWGAMQPDYDLDILKTSVPVAHLEQPVEQFTVRFEEADSAVLVVFEWSDVQINIPVEPA